ncbi:lactam utilization protein LamB [Algoriphagus lacus]|uniref:Lactam utilization protein LamB n=1 Tax=Algoriphagus lacus TaxID=2056311 RepID=A0A418PRL0_9BACT|nr:LamB/YcsF family protein [Algoriphagus lacus]RIW15557.1 lactam utilization protein LamB [Algoriphagus lacus]
MNTTKLTINCDLGEGVPHEELLFPLIDLASVACGGHYGDRESIKATLRLAKEFGKKAGAHPSYPDRENFGRKSLEIPENELIESIRDQIRLFLEIAEELEIKADHIKFHGALYNDAAENPDLAKVLIEFLTIEFPQIPLFVPPYSETEKFAMKKGLPVVREIFGDRAYDENYKLISRKLEGSLLISSEQVIPHLESIINRQHIQTYSGKMIPVEADTLCFHGDNPGIHDFLPLIRQRFWK